MPAPRRRPKVFYPGLKPFFTELRKARGLKQSQAASIAERRDLGVTYQALRGLENGETQHPSPEALRAIATLYGVSYSSLVAEVVGHMYGLPVSAQNERTLTLVNEDDQTEEDFDLVPLLGDRIAAGRPLEIDASRRAGHLAFSRTSLRAMGVIRPLCVRVGHREESMTGAIEPDDVVLLCCADSRREKPSHDRIYAVNWDGGSMLKRVAVGEHGLMLISENPDKERYPTIPIPLEDGATIFDVLVGEVMWRGQQIGGK